MKPGLPAALALALPLALASLGAPGARPARAADAPQPPPAASAEGRVSAAFPEQPSPVVVAGHARFTVVTRTLLRLEYQKDGRFVDARSTFAVNREEGSRRFALTRGPRDATIHIDTGRIELDYHDDGKPFHAKNLEVWIRRGDGRVAWHPGDRPVQNLGGTLTALDAVAEPVAVESGLLARDGWAYVDDSTSAVESGAWYADRKEDAGLDAYLFGYGEDFHAAFTDLTAIAGRVPLPRKTLLGSWYSRWGLLTSADFRTVVKEYAEHEFPLDVVVMDMNWHKDGWTGWSWNRDLLPDAEALLAELHKKDLAVTLNLHPGDSVGPHEDRYADFMRALGKDPATKAVVPFDAGNPRYLGALESAVQAPLVGTGVDFWWLDGTPRTETASVKTLLNAQALNRFYFERTAKDDLRGTSFARWAGWGDHRHPVHFSGDAFAHFRTLAFEIAFTSASSNTGLFFWTHDIGGFKGPFDVPDYPEILARWTQFGALSAALRLHSSFDKRPWLEPPPVLESMRRSFALRARFFPYIYTSAAASARDTWPLVRAMYLDYPGDETAYRAPLQYLLGRDLLVAPITTPGVGPRKVAHRPLWFPRGRWYHVLNGEREIGERETLVSADLDEVPVYARGGVPIPTAPFSTRMATAPLETLIVSAWPGLVGETGRSELYEDDGRTVAYTRGERATTPLLYARDASGAVTVTIGPTEGNWAGQREERAVVVELAATAKPGAALVDGAPAETTYDAATWTTRVAVPSRSIRKPVTVRVDVAEADPALAHAQAVLRRLRGILGNEEVPTPASAPDAALVWAGALKRPGLDPALRSAILALEGYGLVLENDAPTLFPAMERHVAYAPREVPVIVRSFRRSSFRPDETTVTEEPVETPSFPLVLAARIPRDEPGLPPGTIGEHRTRGLAVRFPELGEASMALESGTETVRSFRVAGPWRYDISKDFASQAFGPESPPFDGATYLDRGGERKPWRALEADAEGTLDLKAVSPDDDQVAYVYAELRSPASQDVTLLLSVDDVAVVWVNGAKVYSGTRYAPLVAPDHIAARFDAGTNRVLLRVGQHQGDWRMRLGVVTSAPVHPETR